MVENKIDACESKEESVKITKESKQKSLLLGLLKVVSKIIENLEGKEVLEEETAEKGTNILLKLLKAILTLNKVFAVKISSNEFSCSLSSGQIYAPSIATRNLSFRTLTQLLVYLFIISSTIYSIDLFFSRAIFGT